MPVTDHRPPTAGRQAASLLGAEGIDGMQGRGAQQRGGSASTEHRRRTPGPLHRNEALDRDLGQRNLFQHGGRLLGDLHARLWLRDPARLSGNRNFKHRNGGGERRTVDQRRRFVRLGWRAHHGRVGMGGEA